MRLAVFGGTFDPIHYGHLHLAEEARDVYRLDRVLFVPNWVSPFKLGREMTPGSLRAEMIRRAIRDNSAFDMDTMELDRPGPSYTIDTLRALRTRHADAELYFLTGADAVCELPRWREPEELLSLTRFVAATRFGVSRDEVVAGLPEAWLERISFLEMPTLQISATDLRERVRSERSIRYLTPPVVSALIYERGLYRTSHSASVA